MKTKEIDPFGKITDYISVNQNHEGNELPFTLSDGTHNIAFCVIKLSPSSNWAKPFKFEGENTSILLTYKQVCSLFKQFLNLTKNLDIEKECQ